MGRKWVGEPDYLYSIARKGLAACWDCSDAAALVDTVDTADLVHLDAEDVVAPKALPRGGDGQHIEPLSLLSGWQLCPKERASPSWTSA